MNRGIQDGHLMVLRDPDRPSGGFWCHACESEEKCGKYVDGEEYETFRRRENKQSC